MGAPRPISQDWFLDDIQPAYAADPWILARCKHGYYGGYPGGFLERARRVLVSGNPDTDIWHICGGMSHRYNGAGGMPLSGFGPNDIRIDLDPETDPDILMDVRHLSLLEAPPQIQMAPYDSVIPSASNQVSLKNSAVKASRTEQLPRPSAAIIDRPYTPEDAAKYRVGADVLPNPDQLLIDTLRLVKPFGLVGMLDYYWPDPGDLAKEIFLCNVYTGRKGRARIFTVWQMNPRYVEQAA